MNITEEYMCRLNEAARVELPKCEVVVSVPMKDGEQHYLLVMAFRDGIRLAAPYADGMVRPIEYTGDIDRDRPRIVAAAKELLALGTSDSFQTRDEWFEQVKKYEPQNPSRN